MAQAIKRLGGSTDFKGPGWPSWVPRRLTEFFPDHFLEYAHGVEICDKTGTDAVLERLPSLARLERLVLDGCDVSDHGAEHIKMLGELRFLDLGGTRISDAGLENLKTFRELSALDLSGTRITDDGLRDLRGPPSLKLLWLQETRVSDDGLQYLARLPNLKYVNVKGTAVTSAGIARFHRASPQCSVLRAAGSLRTSTWGG